MTLIPIKDIIVDHAIQSREEMSPEVLQDYTLLIKDGTKFPPIVVFDTAEGLLLADGFHRIEANRLAGNRKIECEIRQGDRRDAILHSIGANIKHGQRMTSADKRRSAKMMLSDPEWAKWSDNEIAKIIGVTQPFISKMRKELITSGEIPDVDIKLAKRGNEVYPIDVKNIKSTPKNLKGRPPSKEDEQQRKDNIERLQKSLDASEEIIEIEQPEIEIPPDKLLSLSSAKKGDVYQLGPHKLYYNNPTKIKSKLSGFAHSLFFGDYTELLKVQPWILSKADGVSVFVNEGSEVLKLANLSLDLQSANLVNVGKSAYFIAHFGNYSISIPNFTVGNVTDYIKLIIEEWLEPEAEVLIINPPQPIVARIHEIDNIATIISTDEEYIQKELINWEQRYGNESPVTKL